MKFEKYIEKYGYRITYIPWGLSAYVNHTQKIIFIQCTYSLKRQHQLCHEIGHVIIQTNIKILKATKNQKSLKIIINEILAWIIGFYICIIMNVEKTGFFTESIRCLKSHFKKQYCK